MGTSVETKPNISVMFVHQGQQGRYGDHLWSGRVAAETELKAFVFVQSKIGEQVYIPTVRSAPHPFCPEVERWERDGDGAWFFAIRRMYCD